MEAITAEIIQGVVGWVVAAVLGAVVSGATTRHKMAKKRASANERGTKCMLRAEIIRDYKEYTEKGCCPIYAKEALHEAFEAYRDLGGNGLAKEKYEACIALPDNPPGEEEEE